MKAYFIIVTDFEGDKYREFYSSIKKAQKARANHRRGSFTVHPTIFKTTWEPTKKGFIARLNNPIYGLPVEGA